LANAPPQRSLPSADVASGAGAAQVASGGLRATGLPQLGRLLAAALLSLWDVLRTAASTRAPERRERTAERVARRWVAALGALKGPYAKLGQFAAIRIDVLPAAATGALADLRDRVPPISFARVRRIVEDELGRPLETDFAGFEPSPLGAASIAQVHRARLHGGETVAVKVQYPWLRSSLAADLAIIRTAFRLAARLSGRPADDAARLYREFADGLREELDFEREARVAREIAGNLSDDDRVVVPEVFPALSTGRVLTMRFHPAVGLADREGLARLGAPLREVLGVLARAYASQIFVDGLFHADPHPGNLFVLDEPAAASAPRLLFVDFGLCRRLDPGLRRELCQGLYALLQRDLDAFLAGMDRMGMIAPGAHAGVRRAVECMFELIAGGGGALALAGAEVLSLKDEAKRLLQETPGLTLPTDLLLYAKTLSYVFSLGADLDPEVDMMKLSLPYALRFLAQREPA
jgi:ubiquinone biosynthesis protein